MVLLLCAVVAVLALVGACGSSVALERTSSADVVAVGDTAPQWPPTSLVPTPVPQLEPEPDVYSADPPTQPTNVATEPMTATPRPLELPPEPATETPRRNSPTCDWQENLEWATVGRLADWIIMDTGAWGRAEVPGERIWIAPRTPCDKVYSVAVHEWTHHMQGVVYGDWGVVLRELAPYGGPEIVADCGALILGATWIKYGCPGGQSSEAAAAILRGERPTADQHG